MPTKKAVSERTSVEKNNQSDKERRLIVKDSALLDIRDRFIDTSKTAHTFINHRPNLTEHFLYRYVLSRILRSTKITAIMPFLRHVRDDIEILNPKRVSEDRIKKYLGGHSNSIPPLGGLLICEANLDISCNFILTLADNNYSKTNHFLIIIDPYQPNIQNLDTVIWRLLRDSRYLNLTIWLHTSPVFVSPSVLDQFAYAYIFRECPTKLTGKSSNFQLLQLFIQI